MMWVLFTLFTVSHCGQVSTKNPHITVSYWDPPLWHTSYYTRMGCDMAYANVEGLKEARFTTLPWSGLPTSSLYLNITCAHGGFSNAFTESINNGSLQSFYSLMSLYIRNCTIHQLNATAFKGLSRLNVLSLHRVGIRHFDPDFLHNIPQVYWIEVMFNDLKTIAPRMFSEIVGLRFLQLRNNNITSINSNEEKFIHVENRTNLALNSLVLESNPIESIPDFAFAGYGVYGILSLKNCSIKNVSKQAFEGLSQIIGIDLSFNLLKDLPDNVFAPINKTLQLIHVTRNNFTHLDLQPKFDGLRELTHFQFNINKLNVTDGSFSIFPKLQHVDLADNCLTKIPFGLFHNNTRLQSLFLQRNSISKIHEASFIGMKSMKYLNISNNRLTSLPSKLFIDLVNIINLNISMNHITTIDKEIFHSCSNLISVDLSYNSLQKLDHNTLNNLTSLEYLNLSFNNISYMSSQIFAKCCRHLKFLDLSGNQISTIGHQLLSSSLLTFLSFRNNSISSLSFNIDMPYIEVFDVGRNHLSTLNKQILRKMKNVRYLYADDNDITSIDSDELKKLSKLEKLHLSQNSLPCDCSVFDFKQWTVSISSRVEMDMIKCMSDGSLKVLRNVSLSYCKNLTLYISVSMATLLALLCIGMGIVFRFRYEIQVVVYCRWGIRLNICQNTNEPEKFEFDGFVSFVHENDDFVLNHLRPFLEDLHQYRLLIHYRDFHVGEDIAANILHSINKSARIIIVLSEEFIGSRWGAFEFEQAFYSILKSKTQKLIVIVMDNKVLQTENDTIVHRITTTKTYVSRDDRLFWKKILFAMPDKEKIIETSSSETNLLA